MSETLCVVLCVGQVLHTCVFDSFYATGDTERGCVCRSARACLRAQWTRGKVVGEVEANTKVGYVAAPTHTVSRVARAGAVHCAWRALVRHCVLCCAWGRCCTLVCLTLFTRRARLCVPLCAGLPFPKGTVALSPSSPSLCPSCVDPGRLPSPHTGNAL